MCGRFTREYTWRDVHDFLDLRWPSAEPPLPPSWNVAPTQRAAIATVDADGGRRLHVARWGLTPSWAGQDRLGSTLFNVRAEGVDQRRAFAAAFRARRCVVPMNSFFEWGRAEEITTAPRPAAATSEADDGARHGQGLFGQPLTPSEAPRGRRSEGRARAAPKQPWSIRRADGALLLVAGLWERLCDGREERAAESRSALTGDAARDSTSAEEDLRRFAIVTTEANAFMQPIHDRMPAVLALEHVATWLAPEAPLDQLRGLLLPAPVGMLTAHRVSRRINSASVDEPSLVEPND